MRAFFVLLKKDLKLLARDKKAVILLVLAPFLFIALFAGVAESLMEDTEYLKPFEIALADGENSIRTRVLVEQLKATGVFSSIHSVSDETAREMVRTGQVPAAIIIPPDFTSSIEIGENKPVEVVGSAAYPYQSRILYNIIESAAAMVSAGQAAVNTIYHYDRLAGIEGEDLEKRFNETVAEVLDVAISRRKLFTKVPGPAGYDVTPYEYMTAAFLSVFLMYTGLPAAKMFINERNSGVFTRVVSFAAKPWQVLVSKIAVTVLIAVFQFTAMFILTRTVFNNYWKGNLPAAIVITLATLFSVLCWSVFVAAASPTPASAEMVGNLGIILMAIAGGCIYPLHILPDIIRKISAFTPNRWAMEGYMAVFSGYKNIDVLNYVRSILGGGLLLLAAALCITAVKAFFNKYGFKYRFKYRFWSRLLRG